MDKRLAEGLTDAIGFFLGAVIGFWIANFVGWDIFAIGYDARSIAGIVLVGIAGGVGVQLARRWRGRGRRQT